MDWRLMLSVVTKEIVVKCPSCGSSNVTKQGIKNGKQNYRCKNPECSTKYFIDSYTYKACSSEVRLKVLKMIANGCGTRATARILHISPNTVTAIIKDQQKEIWQINYTYIQEHLGETIEVEVLSPDQIEVNEVAMDEMWSFVGDKSHQYWLWWAIDHATGQPLAYCFGTREHKYLDELLELLSAFQINTVYVDGNYAYETRFPEEVIVGKKNTQKIELLWQDRIKLILLLGEMKKLEG